MRERYAADHEREVIDFLAGVGKRFEKEDWTSKVQSTIADFGFVLVCANNLCRRGAHLRAELARDLPVTANRKYVRRAVSSAILKG